MDKKLVIQGKEGDWYEKATFILRHTPPKNGCDLRLHANDIIGKYLKTQHTSKELSSEVPEKNNRWINPLFYTSLSLFVLTTILYFLL